MKLNLILFLLFSNLSFGQKINFSQLENQIGLNNRSGKQIASQKKLLEILQQTDISTQDRIRIDLLLATTFRSIGDYGAAINQLRKTQELLKDFDKDDSLKMKINAEMAFIYFDGNQYSKSENLIKELYANKFALLAEDDKAYLIMQQGYIFYLNKKYDLAKMEYKRSLSILKKVSPCDQPVVLVKQMQLYGRVKDLETAQNIYNKTIALADSCKILKYQVYATEELKSIYLNADKKDLALFYSNKLEALKIKSNRDQNISEMHLINEAFLEKEKNNIEKNLYLVLSISLVGIVLLSFLGLSLYRKSMKHKILKDNFEKENIGMKEEILNNSKNHFRKPILGNDILNSSLLNERQKALLKLLSEGFTNKEIAEKLFISENTVKYHVKNIYALLDLKDRKDLFIKLNN